VDRCTVYVFRLPDFGAVATPFTTANLTFGYTDKQGSLRDNDLYGLGRRSSPDVQAEDYYGQTAIADPSDAILLEAGILTNATPFGLITTSATGSDTLRDYLNAQYDSGAGAGQFVFLRLNTAGSKSGIRRATLTMSEGGSPGPVDTRPRLTFTSLAALSFQQQWRTTSFGSPFENGISADDEDPNSDGENNLLEFATGQDPFAGTSATTTLTTAGADAEFTYIRNADALSDGFLFAVEWSDTLLPGSWSQAGVSESVDSQDGSLQTVVATLPTDHSEKRFVRLRVVRP
jgi:hypothetical protein